MKIACVVQRYGQDFAGGSEGHCRAFATRLAASHDVTVLTTCARDHVTWRNAYPAGSSTVDGVRVERFPVVRERPARQFEELSRTVFTGKASHDEETAWFTANGPEAPALIDHLSQHGAGFDRVLFWTFRYYQSYFGLPHVADRAILVPTAEDDPALRLKVLNQFFTSPAGIVFLTPEEQQLIQRHIHDPLPRSTIVGTGLEPPARAAPDAAGIVSRAGIRSPYVLYLGRVEPNKGCVELFRNFLAYRASTTRDLQLVLAGPLNMPVPSHPGILPLGFVEDGVRDQLLNGAAVVAVPSFYESLSIALLEGWNHGVPAIVNARCSVLKGHARRSNGAIYYRDTAEFISGLEHLLAHPDVARTLGAQGRAYVDAGYRWEAVLARLEAFLDER